MAAGDPAEVIDTDALRRTYGVEGRVEALPVATWIGQCTMEAMAPFQEVIAVHVGMLTKRAPLKAAWK